MKRPFFSKRTRLLLFCAICLIGTALLVCLIFTIQKKLASAAFQERLSQKVIRLHVLADSDSYRDQALKLLVRDCTLSYLTPLLSQAHSTKEARTVLKQEAGNVKKQAEQLLRAHSCYESVRVSLQNSTFPVKVYGDLSFPAGSYEAYRIEIGTARGHNWWCVLYPSLCLVDDTVVPAPSAISTSGRKTGTTASSITISTQAKLQLKEELGTKDYEQLLVKDDVSVSFHSYFWDKLCEWFD